MRRRSLVPMLFEWPSIGEEFLEMAPFKGLESNLSISEDEKHVIVEVPVPGLKEADIHVTYHNGLLTVEGSREEKKEDKNKKFYRRASSSYSYQVRVPGDLDDTVEPEAEYEDGLMTVRFAKQKQGKPKKINVKKKPKK